jgi:hypothetical protein
MKIARYILSAVSILAWGYFAWSGSDGIQGIRHQHVAGYPNEGQIRYYVVLPIMMLLASVAPIAGLGSTRWSYISTWWWTFTLLALLPYAFFFTGGI